MLHRWREQARFLEPLFHVLFATRVHDPRHLKSAFKVNNDITTGPGQGEEVEDAKM